MLKKVDKIKYSKNHMSVNNSSNTKPNIPLERYFHKLSNDILLFLFVWKKFFFVTSLPDHRGRQNAPNYFTLNSIAGWRKNLISQNVIKNQYLFFLGFYYHDQHLHVDDFEDMYSSLLPSDWLSANISSAFKKRWSSSCGKLPPNFIDICPMQDKPHWNILSANTS